MTSGLFSLNRPGVEAINGFLAEQGERSVTYADVGATREAIGPSGYRHDQWSVGFGFGETVFERGRLGLQCWATHRGAGIDVTPADAPIVPGQTVVLIVPLFGLHVIAACRIVWTVNADDCFGFGYGTLPGHPERGEEAFLVRRAPRDGVLFEIRAFSRPVHSLARAGGPVTRLLQLRTTRGYLRAMETWCRD